MNPAYAKLVGKLDEEIAAVADRSAGPGVTADFTLAALKILILEIRELKSEISSWPELGSR